MKYYLAIDIGASSGRHIVGWSENGAIKTDEVYRFPNATVSRGGHLFWNTDLLFQQVKKGMKAAIKKYRHISTLAIPKQTSDYSG